MRKHIWVLTETDEELPEPDTLAPIAGAKPLDEEHTVNMPEPTLLAQAIMEKSKKPVAMPVLQAPTQLSPEKVSQDDASIFDHPIIGGKITICVLLYGNYPEMHRQCLNAIITTTPPSRRDIRVACNEVCSETAAFVNTLLEKEVIQRVIVNLDNKKKYPAMRQLFFDDANPVTSNWIIWFDDDSIANRDSAWLVKLLQTIITYYPEGCRLFGAEFNYTLSPTQLAWIKSRPWYKNRPFQLRNGQPAPNGNKIFFAAGGFFAIETALVKSAGIPDIQIGHNGGDYMIGAQVWQAGYKMKGWNNRKQFIHTSSVPRRGLSEVHTGTAGWVPGGIQKGKE